MPFFDRTLTKIGIDMGQGYVPSHFLGMFCTARNTLGEGHAYHDFVTVAKAKPDVSVATKSCIFHLACSASTQIASDRESQVTLILLVSVLSIVLQNQIMSW